LRSQAAVACDFAAIDTALLRRYYVLFFIDITTRKVFFGGITISPTGDWTTQAARNLFLRYGDQLASARALVRDRASQFIDAFDQVFMSEGLKILKTPVRTAVANSIAERLVGTFRRECLDHVIVLNERHLRSVLAEYVEHYNGARPHRSLALEPPIPVPRPPRPPGPSHVVSRPVLSGLHHEYHWEAA